MFTLIVMMYEFLDWINAKFYHRILALPLHPRFVCTDRCNCSCDVLCFHNAFVAASSFFVHTSCCCCYCCCCHFLLPFHLTAVTHRHVLCFFNLLFCNLYINILFFLLLIFCLPLLCTHFFIFTNPFVCLYGEMIEVSATASAAVDSDGVEEKAGIGPTVTTEQPKANEQKRWKYITQFLSFECAYTAQRSQVAC